VSEILFLAHRVPFPPNRGDKIRSAHLLKALLELGPVHVGCFTETAQDVAALDELGACAASFCAPARRKPLAIAGLEALAARKPVSLTAFYNRKLAAWVHHTCAQRPISTIFVFSGQMGQYVPESFSGRVVVDLCDVDSVKFEGYAKAGERVWLNRREGRLLAVEEERLAKRADATLLISEAEASLFTQRLSNPSETRIEVIGNGIDASLFDPAKVSPHPDLEASEGPHFVFTGQMDYRPNEQAALWAIDELLPHLRQRWCCAQLHIVGRSPTAKLLDRRGTDGVTVWGEVPDVKPYLAGAHCVIAPLLIARGVQNKVLEAMAMARPVLLTREAATGIDARDGEHWVVCEADPAAMIAKVEPIVQSSAKRETMGKAARDYVMRHHAWDAKLAKLAELIAPDKGKATLEARHAA